MCSLRVIGYSNGRRIVIEEGPARARVSGYGQGNTHDLTLIGGVREKTTHEFRETSDNQGVEPTEYRRFRP